MAWSPNELPDLTGKTALITGANSGIGLPTAAALAKAGADVIMACRNISKAEVAREKIIELGADPQRLSIEQLDLSSLDNVHDLAARVRDKNNSLNLLINNAGLSMMKREKTEDGFETQLGVNYLGHVALTLDLLPLLADSDDARVISLASVAHFTPGALDIDDLNWERRRFFGWMAYGQSKLAALIFSRELGRRLERAHSPVLSVAAHPGYSRTEIFNSASPEVGMMSRVTALFSQSAEAGAWPTLRAATDPDARNGDYFGPLLNLVGPAARVYSLPVSRDPKTGQRLWAKSLEMLDMEEPDVLATS